MSDEKECCENPETCCENPETDCQEKLDCQKESVVSEDIVKDMSTALTSFSFDIASTKVGIFTLMAVLKEANVIPDNVASDIFAKLNATLEDFKQSGSPDLFAFYGLKEKKNEEESKIVTP